MDHFIVSTTATPGPLVTVAMPVFNGGRHLELAVASIVGQTYRRWELYLVDDGSTDGAIERLPMLDDPRIRVLRDGKNLGLAARLNQIIDLANGDFIARMDGDDVAYPERFERQVAALLHNPKVDLLACRCATISEDGQRIGQLPFVATHEEICRSPWQGFYMPHPSWMGQIEWFRKFRYASPAPYCCEDQELLLRSYEASRFMALREELLAYRLRDRVIWRKAWRTRAALAGVQVRHFAQRRQYVHLALSLLTCLGRHGKDVFESSMIVK